MKNWIILEKPLGATPLETLRAWVADHPEYADMPASYAGRLDPMASGKLLILLGDECKRQSRYTRLDKEYEIEVLLDLATDTGDVLGLPSHATTETHPEASAVTAALRSVRGPHLVPYPAFSSKTVAGKPLFLHALEDTLGIIEIPTHEETIHRITLLEHTEISKGTLAERINALVQLAPRSDEPSKALGADFRQDEIRAAWKELLEGMPGRTFSVLRLRVVCGSGTYMRTLAGRIGRALGTTGLALSIHRSRIGRYRAGFWLRTYR